MKFIEAIIIHFFCVTIPAKASGQKNPYWLEPTAAEADSLKKALKSVVNDSERMHINRQLGMYYQEINRYFALEYYETQLQLAKLLKQKIWEAEAMSRIGYVSSLMANYPRSLNSLLAAREIVSAPKSSKELWNAHLIVEDGNANRARLLVLANINNHLGVLNYFVGNYEKALEFYEEAVMIGESINDFIVISFIPLNRGESYIGLGKYDLAKTELGAALDYFQSLDYNKYTGLIYWDIGKIYETEGNYSEARKFYYSSVSANIESDSPDFLGEAYLALANLYMTTGSLDSSYQSAQNGLLTYRLINDSLGLIKAYSTLAALFDALGEIDSAYYYMKKGTALKSAMNREERVKEFQVLGLNEQLRLKELEAERVLQQSRLRVYGLVAGIGVLILISMIIYKNNLRQKKDKAIIQKSFINLKATQAQLIHAEKMASLGELTAGIAHEIQNPLNFVNNFAEVSGEMFDELEEELAKGNGRLAKEIAKDIKQNLEKIHHHGKRADAIVKGMLQHSRTNSGQKELTDINALADEYLRMSYHGLRAKDKSFNAHFETHFDPNLPKIEVVPQDIGRVLLNLINNAFYAVNEKVKLASSDYKPVVVVKTSRGIDKIEIGVIDNGGGIPEEIKNKIFQPFFTTKPTGHGTGLGLSLSYDILKAHGGNLLVASSKDDSLLSDKEGTTFIIQIPIEKSEI